MQNPEYIKLMYCDAFNKRRKARFKIVATLLLVCIFTILYFYIHTK